VEIHCTSAVLPPNSPWIREMADVDDARVEQRHE
jgi:hypothetical protein